MRSFPVRPDGESEDPRPYAYQTGKVEFFYLPFRSDERALVPRLETESLVREVLSELRSGDFDAVVDVGTGSGIIAVSLAKNHSAAKYVALDFSRDALSLAAENAQTNSVDVDFRFSDLLSGLPEWVGNCRSVYFVANLPYVRDGDDGVSEDTAFEPAMALYGGAGTGFELTRRFLDEIERFHSAHPSVKIAVASEVGDDHEEEILRAGAELGRDVRLFADLLGIRRFFTYRIWPS